MKSKEVLELLQITRPTLTKYVKEGIIKVQTLPNGRYEYDDRSVYKLFNKGIERKTYIYARVATSKQKEELNTQVNLLKQFCFSNGYVISKVYTDIASDTSFEKRKEFFAMLDDIISGKVERVVITYKDRLTMVGFELFSYLFKKYHCDIVVMSEVGYTEIDGDELVEEVVSLLGCYSIGSYTKRKANRIKDILMEDRHSSL